MHVIRSENAHKAVLSKGIIILWLGFVACCDNYQEIPKMERWILVKPLRVMLYQEMFISRQHMLAGRLAFHETICWHFISQLWQFPTFMVMCQHKEIIKLRNNSISSNNIIYNYIIYYLLVCLRAVFSLQLLKLLTPSLIAIFNIDLEYLKLFCFLLHSVIKWMRSLMFFVFFFNYCKGFQSQAVAPRHLRVSWGDTDIGCFQDVSWRKCFGHVQPG